MRLLLSLALLTAVGCPISTTIDPSETVPLVLPGEVGQAVIGPEGGSIGVGSLTIQVPTGALATPTDIRMVVTDATVPAGFTGFSPIIRLEPEGLRFERPIQIEVPFRGDGEVATVFWTREGGSEFVARPTTTEGGLAFASNTHFSQVFVGTACEGGDCCRRATGELDVLLMVDNSNSMSQEQSSLVAQIPRLVEALATGDVNGDGIQEFPAVESLRIGTVSSDMGVGGFSVFTCNEPNFGDDGLLRTRGNTMIAGCAAIYPSYLSFSAATDTMPAAFAQDVTCVAALGSNGCGFEQQLDAMLKAVTPSTAIGADGSPVTFANGTTGHADGANAGFLRSDAVLALINLTDEDDCSAIDPDVFNEGSARYPGSDLNLRCFQYPEAVQPVSRYVHGFASLKADPSAVVYATISGIPTDLEGESYDTILADPRMIERPDPEARSQLTPSCDVEGRGLAFPPRRLIETARGLEEEGVLTVATSICQENLTVAVSAILARVADSVSGACR